MRATLAVFLSSSLFALSVHGQSGPEDPKLEHYVNDPLGFSMLVPCTPEALPGTFEKADHIIACGTPPQVMIAIDLHPPAADRDLDDYIKREVVTEPAPTVSRAEVDGSEARRVSCSIQGLDQLILVVLHKDALYIVSVLQRSGSGNDLGPKILDSLKFL